LFTFPSPSSRVDQRCTKSAQPDDPHGPTRATANIGSSPNRGSQSSSRRRCRGANATEFSCQAPTLRTLRVTSPSSHQPHSIPPHPKADWPGSLMSPPTASGLLEPIARACLRSCMRRRRTFCCGVCQRENNARARQGNDSARALGNARGCMHVALTHLTSDMSRRRGVKGKVNKRDAGFRSLVNNLKLPVSTVRRGNRAGRTRCHLMKQQGLPAPGCPRLTSAGEPRGWCLSVTLEASNNVGLEPRGLTFRDES
jgi:hypothetical protein